LQRNTHQLAEFHIQQNVRARNMIMHMSMKMWSVEATEARFFGYTMHAIVVETGSQKIIGILPVAGKAKFGDLSACVGKRLQTTLGIPDMNHIIHYKSETVGHVIKEGNMVIMFRFIDRAAATVRLAAFTTHVTGRNSW
jgi:hypothetical protein